MQYRKFGHTALTVSEIGFGAWAIGGGAMIGTTAIGWGDTDDAISKKAIYAALDAGITFFDTADIYGLGHSEQLIGSAIGNRGDVVVATKVGNVARNQQFTTDYSKRYILEACEASLRHLQRDCIDYYQLHTARLAHLQQGDCIAAMQQLQQQGKIRYWGLSLNTFEPEEDARYLMQHKLGNGFQLALNIINQTARHFINEASEMGYGIIARMPLQFGMLTGKFDAGVHFSENDHRKKRLTPQLITNALEVTAPVWELCNKYNCSKTQLALSFLLSYEGVSTIIPGICTPEQVLLNTDGLFQLQSADRQLIELLGNTAFGPLLQQLRALG